MREGLTKAINPTPAGQNRHYKLRQRSLPVMCSKLLLLALIAAGLAGCATPFRAPADVAHIKLERADSPVVIVQKIWLERKAGSLAVKGSVLKRLSATDTTQTHLDVTLYSSSGQVLRRTVEHFDPRQIRHRFRGPGYGEYRVVLDPLPAETARIEVAAHEGEHSAAP